MQYGLQERVWGERDPREPREEVMEMREAKVRGTEPGPWQWEDERQVPGTQLLNFLEFPDSKLIRVSFVLTR